MVAHQDRRVATAKAEASWSACCLPSTTLALPCRLNPIPCNIRATARSEIGCPVLVNAAARLRVDLVVHTSNDIGSPRVSGSTNAFSATANSGSVSASFLRPPPGARTRPDPVATLPHPAADDVAAHPDAHATPRTFVLRTPQPAHHRP